MVTHCFHDEIFTAQVKISPCELNYLRSLVMPLINLFNSISCRTLFSGLFLLWVMLGMIMGNHAFSALTEADRIQKCCRKPQVHCRLVWGDQPKPLAPRVCILRCGPDRMRTLDAGQDTDKGRRWERNEGGLGITRTEEGGQQVRGEEVRWMAGRESMMCLGKLRMCQCNELMCITIEIMIKWDCPIQNTCLNVLTP